MGSPILITARMAPVQTEDNSKPAKTEKPDKEEINKAPKTADLSGIGMASFGLFGSATIAAMATMFKRKRRTDEE